MTPDHALAMADRLATLTTWLHDAPSGWRQSLAHGAAGIVLLHAELAATGTRSWKRVQDWLAILAAGPVTSGPAAGPLHGAPGVAHTLACVATARPGACRSALQALDEQIATDTRRRLHDAQARMDVGRLPTLGEFDAIRGLAGIGAYLLHRDPGGLLPAVLGYLVRLCQPLTHHGHRVPGWWTPTAPTGRPDPANYPGGHGNAGMAHGIGGPLSLLALAALHDVQVPGQTEAIDQICGWLDDWHTSTADYGCRWPYLVTHADHVTGRRPASHDGASRRPSWCYGTAGLARAQQLAALATGDTRRRQRAEQALIGALTDPTQRAATVDASLCHGHTGLALIAARAAADAADPTALHALLPELLDAADPDTLDGGGLLEGDAGAALATHLQATGHQSATGWDRCLLIS